VNKLYRNLILERIRFALASAEAAADLEHSGVKGALRETLIADLLRPLLPVDVAIATGIVISADDQQSAQQDILVFDRHLLPALSFEGGLILIPVESVLATIEVKSCLTAGELRKAHTNATSVRRLDIQSGTRDERGNYIDPRILAESGETIRADPLRQCSAPVALLFALRSDLCQTGKSEIDRYAEICSEDPHVFSALCVVGRGLFGPTQRLVYDKTSEQYRTFNNEPLQRDLSMLVASDDQHNEVLCFIESVLDLLRRVSTGRGEPPLSAYFRVGERAESVHLEFEDEILMVERVGQWPQVRRCECWKGQAHSSLAGSPLAFRVMGFRNAVAGCGESPPPAG
jgi:hypothetical protein